nr:hypothetical protein [Tanacetum cinerariifolium]
MSSYEVIVNVYFGMPIDPLDPYAPPSPDYIPGPEAPPSPDYIPGPEAPPSPDYIPRPEYLEYLSPADDVLPAEEQPLPASVSPTAESPGYIMESEPKMEPEEDDGDDEKSKEDSIDYSASRGDDDADDFSEDDVVDEDKEGSSDRTPPLLPIPLPTSSFALPLLLPSTSGSESVPEADMPLRKRARFTNPTGGYEDASTLQRQQIDDEDRLTRHIQHEHAQRDDAPEDGDSCSKIVLCFSYFIAY